MNDEELKALLIAQLSVIAITLSIIGVILWLG